jgi:hypothetical protein
MQDFRDTISTFAAAGFSSIYTELYDNTAVYEALKYLDQKFPWSRTNYLNYYGSALASSDCFHKLEYASGKIENALDALYNYTDAKTNDPNPDKIDAARKAFLN